MEIREILSKCDHTLLAPQATFEEIRQVCDEGIRYGTASVCIPPCFVKEAKSYVGRCSNSILVSFYSIFYGNTIYHKNST